MTNKTSNNELTTEAENRRRSLLMLERWIKDLEQANENYSVTKIKNEN